MSKSTTLVPKYYSVRVKMEYQDDNGRPKKKTELYIVRADSVTEAEALIATEFKSYTSPFEVTSATSTRIVDVIDFKP